jgi:NADH:ubiquinone oxidoreductase subunit 6 (subunit J)
MLNFFEGVPFFTYIFYLYFGLIFTFTGLIIFTPNSVASVLYLVLVFIFTSFSFILLGMEYLGLIYIIVYIGAIAVLFLFVLMLINIRNVLEPVEDRSTAGKFFLVIVAVLITELVKYFSCLTPRYIMMSNDIDLSLGIEEYYISYISHIATVSSAVFNVYFWYLIFCAVILLVIMFGVVLLVTSNIFPIITLDATVIRQHNKILKRYEQSILNTKPENDL